MLDLKKKTPLKAVLLVTLVGYFIPACTGIEPVAKKEEQKEEKPSTSNVKPKAIRKTQQKVQKYYVGIGKRDPFHSYLTKLNQTQEETTDAETTYIKSATEKFRLEQYRLTALITGTSRPHAMVADPGGGGHILRIGSRIGKNGGRVTRITGQGVTVTLETNTSSNKKVRVTKTLTLPKADFDLVGQNNR